MIQLKSLGAARTVTGSKHLISTSQSQILLDCGLFQGHRDEANSLNSHFSIDGQKLNAVVLSHAHLDHCGALPCLYLAGFRGPIFATKATKDLCALMLLDSAHIMASDAEHVEHLIHKGNKQLKSTQVLYVEKDVISTMEHFKDTPYHGKTKLGPGIDLGFFDAGHVLGSAISVLDIESASQKIRFCFSGDLGRKHLPILRAPEVPDGITHLMLESTYGDRLHDPIEAAAGKLADLIEETHKRGGKIIIPSFALERAQEIIYVLKNMFSRKKIPQMPVYLDSPLVVRLTEVFRKHPECYNADTLKLLQSADSPFDFPNLRYISSLEDSKKISATDHSCIVISASGMCEGGRVLHHLAAAIQDPKNTILLVGFQAEHTLGRRLLEQEKRIKIFGNIYNRQAAVVSINGFSGHADRQGLLQFVDKVNQKGQLKKIYLVHGEIAAQESLKAHLKSMGFPNVDIMKTNEAVTI